jgi:hypothetical protein
MNCISYLFNLSNNTTVGSHLSAHFLSLYYGALIPDISQKLIISTVHEGSHDPAQNPQTMSGLSTALTGKIARMSFYHSRVIAMLTLFWAFWRETVADHSTSPLGRTELIS